MRLRLYEVHSSAVRREHHAQSSGAYRVQVRLPCHADYGNVTMLRSLASYGKLRHRLLFLKLPGLCFSLVSLSYAPSDCQLSEGLAVATPRECLLVHVSASPKRPKNNGRKRDKNTNPHNNADNCPDCYRSFI